MPASNSPEKSDRDIAALYKLAADAYSTKGVLSRPSTAASASSKQADEMLAGFSLDIFYTNSPEVTFAVL